MLSPSFIDMPDLRGGPVRTSAGDGKQRIAAGRVRLDRGVEAKVIISFAHRGKEPSGEIDQLIGNLRSGDRSSANSKRDWSSATPTANSRLLTM